MKKVIKQTASLLVLVGLQASCGSNVEPVSLPKSVGSGMSKLTVVPARNKIGQAIHGHCVVWSTDAGRSKLLTPQGGIRAC